MLFTKAVVIVYMLSAGDYEFLNWKNTQEYLQVQRVSSLSDNVLPMSIQPSRLEPHL